MDDDRRVVLELVSIAPAELSCLDVAAAVRVCALVTEATVPVVVSCFEPAFPLVLALVPGVAGELLPPVTVVLVGILVSVVETSSLDDDVGVLVSEDKALLFFSCFVLDAAVALVGILFSAVTTAEFLSCFGAVDLVGVLVSTVAGAAIEPSCLEVIVEIVFEVDVLASVVTTATASAGADVPWPCGPFWFGVSSFFILAGVGWSASEDEEAAVLAALFWALRICSTLLSKDTLLGPFKPMAGSCSISQIPSGNPPFLIGLEYLSLLGQ